MPSRRKQLSPVLTAGSDMGSLEHRPRCCIFALFSIGVLDLDAPE